jgi:membrane protease YdiL (CAAX protease family)
MAMTAVVGCALGGLYAASGSLLLPILLHALLDARGALLSKANLGEA